MQFDSVSDFFYMGGYALYVWLSFGMCFVVMIGLAVQSRYEHKKLLSDIDDEQQRQARIRRAQSRSSE